VKVSVAADDVYCVSLSWSKRFVPCSTTGGTGDGGDDGGWPIYTKVTGN